jgi:hypothetical protein
MPQRLTMIKVSASLKPSRRSVHAYFHRSARAWLLIAACFGMALFYAYVVWIARHPTVGEAYQRTFMTGEFAVYPQSTQFRPRDGLAYQPGTTIEVADKPARWYLSRFDWWRFHPPVPYLRNRDGRVFMSIPTAARRPDRPHRLVMEFTCRYPAGTSVDLAISVNGTPVGRLACAQGSVRLDTVLPAGLFPRAAYEEIRIERPDLSLWERVATRVSLRFDAVALDRFSITPLE